MANTRQQSIRLQQARKSSNRVSSQPRKQLKPSFISRSRYLTGEANKQRAMDDVIRRLNTTNNINEQIKILDSAPISIRTNVQQIRSQLLSSHNNTIAKLELNLKSDTANADKSRYRERRANNEHEEQRYNQEIDRFDAKVSALKTIISDMKAGKSYDYNSVNSYVYNVGFAAMRGKRGQQEYTSDLANAQSLAEQRTIKLISEAGMVNVLDKNRNLIGYQTTGNNPTQYRFNKQGNPVLYSSPEFKPIIRSGKIVGYSDTVARQSIKPSQLNIRVDKYRAKNLKDYKEYKVLQNELHNTKLPSGYVFDKNKDGDIVGFTDKKLNISSQLSDLVNIPFVKVPDSLKRTSANLRAKAFSKFFTKDEFAKYYPKPIKFFTSNNWIKYTNDKQYYYYKKNHNGTLSKQDFLTVKNSIAPYNKKWKAFMRDHPEEAKKVNDALFDSLQDQIKNPELYGTMKRINALLVISSAMGGSSLGAILIGSYYHGTLGLLKDVAFKPLPKNFKETARLVGKNYGWGAVQGLIYGSAIYGGSALVKTFGKKLIPMSFAKVAGKKALATVTKVAIRRGLSMLGVMYVSKLAGRTTFNIKNIIIGDAPAGVADLSKDLGTLTGFGIPSFISARIKAGSKNMKDIYENKNGKVKLTDNQKKYMVKQIRILQKFEKAQINSVYLKAKNAQLKDITRGGFKASGISKKLSKESINRLSKIANANGITKTELMDGSFYVQTIKVESKLPETQGLLKFYKSLLRGVVGKTKLPAKFYEFKRYGVVVAKATSSGTIKASAIEFNYANGRVSNIGFKSAVGQNKITAINVYKKIRKLSGKPIRLRLKDEYLVRNKFETNIPENEELIKTLNNLETKKVIMNNKRITSKEIISLKMAIKSDFKLASNQNLSKFLKRLYSDKGITSKSGETNVLRIQRLKKGIELKPVIKKGFAKSVIKVYPKGKYVEVGHTKFRIPSRSELRMTTTKKSISRTSKNQPRQSKAIPKSKSGISPSRGITRKPTQVRGRPQRTKAKSMQIQIKKTVLKSKGSLTRNKIRTVENAVKSIQTIVRPTTRMSSFNTVISTSASRMLVRQISLLLPLVSTNNASALRSVQSNLQRSISIQRSEQVSKQGVKQIRTLQQIKALRLSAIQILQSITMMKPVTAMIVSPKVITKPITRAKKKTPIRVGLQFGKAGKVVKKKGVTTGYNSYVYRKKVNTKRTLPITKARALDLLAYHLDKNTSVKGLTIKGIRRVSPAVLNRRLKSTPKNYFVKNRNKFILRKLTRGKETYEMIEKKKFRRDSKVEKRRKKR